MPTYAYRCSDCGFAFDTVQSFTDEALTECPKCGGRLRKQYGSIGVTFNGGGFYRTDSRAGASAEGGSGAGSDSGKSSGTTSSGDSASSSGASKVSSSSSSSAPASGSSSD